VFPEKGSVFGKDWEDGFLKRNDDIFVLQEKRSMSKNQSNALTYDKTIIFCNVFEDMIGDYELKNIPLHPDTLCNMDETLL
jgi:hypothetical protein